MSSAGSMASPPAKLRTARSRKYSAAAKSMVGQSTSATVSPVAMLPVTAEAASMMAAIGASTSRDQCMTKPPGGPMRYWVRSNQPWPPIRSRTSTRRSMLSLSAPLESVGNPAAACSAKESQRGEQRRARVADPAGQFVRRRGGQGHLVGGLQLDAIMRPPKPSLNGFNK